MSSNELDERIVRAARIRAAGGTQTDAADAVGVTARTVRRWESDAELWERALEAAASGAPRPDTAPDGPDSPSLYEAKRRKEAALARLRELEVLEREGQLITIDDAMRPVEALLALVRARLLALPGRIAGALPMQPVEALELIEPIVHEAMEDLSTADEEAAA